MIQQQSHAISMEEKSRYLTQLDAALGSLAKHLIHEVDDKQRVSLTEFGKEHNWDFKRILGQKETYTKIADLVKRVQKEYLYFGWVTESKNPEENRGYFDEISISSESGLPWVFDFIERHRLKKDSQSLLKALPTYALQAKELICLTTGDTIELEDVVNEGRKLFKEALKRNFLETLSQPDTILLDWQSTDYSAQPESKLLMQLGGEELWNINFIRYSPDSSMFEAYVIDLWQDIREPQIGRAGKISQDLCQFLKNFGKDNAAWYVLSSIDEQFKSLHPVHVSKALIGPFENKYLTKPDSIPSLPITGKLLQEDQNTGLFRFSRQYTYAPNHKTAAGELRQIIYRENWCDEIIVCPAKYSERVAKSVLGTNVRIFEM